MTALLDSLLLIKNIQYMCLIPFFAVPMHDEQDFGIYTRLICCHNRSNPVSVFRDSGVHIGHVLSTWNAPGNDAGQAALFNVHQGTSRIPLTRSLAFAIHRTKVSGADARIYGAQEYPQTVVVGNGFRVQR